MQAIENLKLEQLKLGRKGAKTVNYKGDDYTITQNTFDVGVEKIINKDYHDIEIDFLEPDSD